MIPYVITHSTVKQMVAKYTMYKPSCKIGQEVNKTPTQSELSMQTRKCKHKNPKTISERVLGSFILHLSTLRDQRLVTANLNERI